MRRAAQVYIVENDTYLAHHAAHRPPPCVDLWELFAGQARMTELAQEYELNALQPMDLRFGQDFKDASTRDYIMHKIKKFKPWLIPMGVDCRLWNQFSINLNWSSPERQEQLQVLQQQERLLVHFATDVAKEQYMNGRFFLIENPLRSRLWQEPALQELLALPGVWSTTLDAGAYGAEVDGQPICKPMRWVGNAPGMDLALHRRLDHLEKQYCTPVQGTLTRRSQEYPDNLCRQILQELRAIAFQKEPTRFGRPLHHVLAVSYPTTDLDAWNDVANYISGAYERSNKRPFEIPLDTEMGRNIQQLFRVKAIKIQACFAPTCRRIPSNVDEYFTRAAFLQYMDKTRAVEVEDLDEIQFPRQRFDKPVEIAVFAYGFRMMAPEHREQAPASSDKPAIVPGLMTDVSFDTKEALDSTIKRSAFDENYNPKLRAELVRCEAQKCLLDLNASQQLRRALLRKTRNTAIPDLQPGQRCAVWRWSKRGVRKRGAWLTARFLSWDPGHVGKQAWVRLGASTTLVTAEQLRTAHGFEDWTPDQEDIKALKNAADSFTQHMLEDERGEPPPEQPPEELADMPVEYDGTPPPPTPSMMVPATPATAAPATPPPPVAHQQATAIQVHIDSPTNIHHQHTTVHQRFGDLPKSLSRSRRQHGPYTKGPTSSQAASPPKEVRTQPDDFALADTSALASAATLLAPQHLADNAMAVLGHTTPQSEPFHQPTSAEHLPAVSTASPSSRDVRPHALHQQQHDNRDTETMTATAAAAEAHGGNLQVPPQSAELHGTPVELPPETQQEAMEQEALPTLPQKRPFDSMHTLAFEADGTITTMNPTWGGTPPQGFGKASCRFHKIYLTTQQRQQDEAQKVLRDKILSKRILRSRACYRDKNVGQGELKAKCRIVCLGHLDPDLELLDRSAPTPGRTTEMLMLAMITAGANGELFETQLKWHAWTADAATAFLQGQQPSERPMELYMYPPKDGLIEMTPCWSHPLYQVMGNVYGLANAPALWCSEVVARLKQLNYTRHSFDPMLFIKREGQQIVSMILVYVDDFIGVYRSGYPIEEVKNAFAWGSFHDLSKQVVTFKGKELHLHQLANKRWKLKITMSKFLNGLTPAKLPKGRTSSPPELTPTEQREFRSVSGCLQWASTQCRPEIGAAVSLSNQGNETTCHNLKDLYEAMSFLKNTPHEGLLMQDIPVNTKTVIASAADEASDRAAYVNMTLSEILFDGPAHRLGCRVDYVQTTDAKSLYDAICSEAPNLTDKRSLCNVRAIQETVDKSRMHWLPSNCQFADGLTKVSELLRTTFRKWLNAPFSILLDHPANEGLLSGIASCTKEKKTSENLKPPDCHVGTTDSFHAQS
ncbi:unnamed protein product [Durusdinium trenchii]|uniref:Reverse transcriptase Ty1/copia-type domain-containing protein n=1 Tax=Durusdinium trenchii TaxID=1381693 RepID=A0ABP0PNY6_9DINO